jgi:glycerol-1-phosphate dehydrogenase [NAD(P)+]
MSLVLPIYIGSDVISELIGYCRENHVSQLTLVADQNTYTALGRRLGDALRDQEVGVKTVVLSGEEVIADEQFIMQVLVRAEREDQTYLAVGSGTITDITRFVSHRTKSSFISVPTAPSVDGFTSTGAPIVVGGAKKTFITQPPLAIFVDSPTITSAPQRLIAAGFGDMVGKFTSLADWKLGHILWDEPYDEAIAQRARTAVENCVRIADQIGRGSEASIRTLMEGLLESGLCMLDSGSSRPASGAEHHCSHYWEMKLLWEHRPALLHGTKVGVASIFIAEEYEKVRRTTRQQLIQHLKDAKLPDREQEVQRIRMAYGVTADDVIEAQSEFLNMSADKFDLLKQRIIDQWSLVQDIAAAVPGPQELADVLEQAAAETSPQSLGLSDQEVKLALDYGHYLRNRLTVSKLKHLIGLN